VTEVGRGRLIMDPEPSEKDEDTSDWYERLYKHFAPMREEALERSYAAGCLGPNALRSASPMSAIDSGL
jgi:hypothetical protein